MQKKEGGGGGAGVGGGKNYASDLRNANENRVRIYARDWD